jgi:hypothetical protein
MTEYTVAQLELQVILHREGRVTLPAKMLKKVEAEIVRRNGA